MNAMTHSAPLPIRRPLALAQAGLTLIELMVAMALGLLIALAAAAALLVSRQGFFAVDAGSQLRDNARYAQDIVQRVGVQAGFKNVFFTSATNAPRTTEPHVFGINNAKRSTSNGWDESSGWGTNDAGKNSDILVLRSQPGSAIDTTTQTLYPLGTSAGSATGTTGSAFGSSGDVGAVYTAPADRRLRQVVTFTVHLRNFQDLGPN